jgi:lysophospholipase L1-like esterase
VVEQSPSVERKPHGIGFKLAAIFGGLVVVFVLVEIGLRVYFMVSGGSSVNPIPPSEVFTIGKLNQLIARIPEDPNRTRILFLGDSFTYGTGVEPNEALVVKVGALLEKWKPGRYQTINLGVPGADSTREWALYNRARDRAHADLVVHVISPRTLDMSACKDLFVIHGFLMRRLWTSRFSILSALVEQKIRAEIGDRRFIAYLKGGATPEERERAWRVYSREISCTKRLAEEGGAAYVIVRFPLVSHLEDYPLEDVHRRGAALAAELNVPHLDLLDVFRGRSSASMTLRGDPHPNPAAYTIAAKAVADFLIQRVLPKLPAPSTTKRTLKMRTPEEVTADEIRHHQETLRMEPNCMAAKFWLDRVLVETSLQNRPSQGASDGAGRQRREGVGGVPPAPPAGGK